MAEREPWEPKPRQVYNPRTRRWETEGVAERPTVATSAKREWTIPFGKHCGDPLSEIESGYLRWVQRECDISPALAAAIQEELDQR